MTVTATAVFAQTPMMDSARPRRDSAFVSGTYTTLMTAGANGARIEEIVCINDHDAKAGLINIFVEDGTGTYRLVDSIDIINDSNLPTTATDQSLRIAVPYKNFIVPANGVVKCSFTTAWPSTPNSLFDTSPSGSGTSWTTGTLNANNEDVYLVSIVIENTGGTAPTVSSITGAGITWSLVKRENSLTSLNVELWVGATQSGATSQQLTITTSGSTTGIRYAIDAIDHVSSGGSGTNAIVQSASNAVTATSVTVTLGAFDDAAGTAGNYAFMVVGAEQTGIGAATGANWTTLGGSFSGAPVFDIFTAYSSDDDTTGSDVAATNCKHAGIMVELQRQRPWSVTAEYVNF